jgi:DNA-binding protein HU-beta
MDRRRVCRAHRTHVASKSVVAVTHQTNHKGEPKSMNKSELTDAVAAKADISKADAGRTIDALIEVIGRALKKKDKVAVVGFGTFMVRERKARMGRNPKTKEQIKIKASKTPAFKAGKALKDAIK